MALQIVPFLLLEMLALCTAAVKNPDHSGHSNGIPRKSCMITFGKLGLGKLRYMNSLFRSSEHLS